MQFANISYLTFLSGLLMLDLTSTDNELQIVFTNTWTDSFCKDDRRKEIVKKCISFEIERCSGFTVSLSDFHFALILYVSMKCY